MPRLPIWPSARCGTVHGDTATIISLQTQGVGETSCELYHSNEIMKFYWLNLVGTLSAASIMDSGALGTNLRKKSASLIRRFD